MAEETTIEVKEAPPRLEVAPLAPKVEYRGEFLTSDLPFKLEINAPLLGKFLQEKIGFTREEVENTEVRVLGAGERRGSLGKTAAEAGFHEGKFFINMRPQVMWDFIPEGISKFQTGEIPLKTFQKELGDLFVTKRIPQYIEMAEEKRARKFLSKLLLRNIADLWLFETAAHEAKHLKTLYSKKWKRQLVLGIQKGMGGLLRLGLTGVILYRNYERLINIDPDIFTYRILKDPKERKKWRNLVRVRFDRELLNRSLEEK